MRMQTINGPRWASLATVLTLVVNGCSGSSTATPSPTAAPSPARTAAATTAPASALLSPGPTLAATQAPPSVGTGTCPSVPADLATVRDLAKAGQAVGCFGNQPLTFRGYVPTTDSLGGVPASKMTPAWIADPWTGAILQPGPTAEADQSAWFVTRVTPALGKCRATDVQAAGCPFGPYLNSYVTVTGHFKDTAASTCKSVALPGQSDPGPSKSKMVANCRREFVVTAIAAG